MPRNHRPSKVSSKQRKPVRPNLTWLGIALGVVVVAVAAFFMFQSASSVPTEISAAQAREKIQQGAFLLDVRTKQEWDQERIANSTLIPLDELSNRLSELPRDKDIVVVCASGARSKSGAIILRQAGFPRAVSMIKGLLAWKMAGYPLEGNGP